MTNEGREACFRSLHGVSRAVLCAGMLSCLVPGCDEVPLTRQAQAAAAIKSSGGRVYDNVSETALDEGRETFVARCGQCHGAEGKGRVGIGPALASKTFLEAASDEMLFDTISNGRAGTTMVAWSQGLQPQQIRAVVAHIRTLAEHEPVELDETPVAGDIEAGKLMFSTICARCHGRSGGGYQESSSGTGIGRKAFMDSVTNGYLRHLIKNGKTQTMMRPFGESEPTAVANLTDQQVEDVIAFLRDSAW